MDSSFTSSHCFTSHSQYKHLLTHTHTHTHTHTYTHTHTHTDSLPCQIISVVHVELYQCSCPVWPPTYDHQPVFVSDTALQLYLVWNLLFHACGFPETILPPWLPPCAWPLPADLSFTCFLHVRLRCLSSHHIDILLVHFANTLRGVTHNGSTSNLSNVLLCQCFSLSANREEVKPYDLHSGLNI